MPKSMSYAVMKIPNVYQERREKIKPKIDRNWRLEESRLILIRLYAKKIKGPILTENMV